MSTEPEAELDQLVARLADGDRSAFAPAFRLLWPPALRLCRSMLKNDADAADAAQQAMEKVLQRASEYDRQRAALPWALAIAAWECRTILRKSSRRREVSAELAPERVVEGADADFEHHQLLQNVSLIVGELSANDRETLLAAFREESDVAMSATFRKRRERALKRLKAAFRSLYGL